jgi:hypothetical protein
VKRRRCAILLAVQQVATYPAVEEELSLEEEFLLAVIRQRFGWLTGVGCDSGEALLMATLTQLSPLTALQCLRPGCRETLATPVLRRVA